MPHRGKAERRTERTVAEAVKLTVLSSLWMISAVVKFHSQTPYRSVKTKEREETERGDETVKRDRDTVRGRVLHCLIRQLRQDSQ